MRLRTHPPRSDRRRQSSAGVLLAVVALLAVVLAAGGVGGGSSGTELDRVTIDEHAARVGTEPGSAPSRSYRPVEAVRRTGAVPAAALAASVVLTGWAFARRFVPPPGRTVRSWAGRPAWGNRGPPHQFV